MNIALIFAGGKGTRMGASLPKQFLKINGKEILFHTIDLFQRNKNIDIDVIGGGDSAQDTIYRLLVRATKDNPGDSIVLLHDGVRPFVAPDVIEKNIEGVKKHGNAITSFPAYETIMISKDHDVVDDVTVRANTYLGQAPQSFYLKDILEAHEKIRMRPEGYENMVDAATIIRTLGGKTHLVMGNRGNLKITTPEDVYTFRAFLQYKEDKETFGLGL